jgi:hypothetical protein
LSIGTGHTPLVLFSIAAFIQVGIATALETIVKRLLRFDSNRNRNRSIRFSGLGGLFQTWSGGLTGWLHIHLGMVVGRQGGVAGGVMSDGSWVLNIMIIMRNAAVCGLRVRS